MHSLPHTRPLYYPTLDEWYSNPFARILASSESLGWNNLVVRTARLDPISDFAKGPATQGDNLIFLLEGSTQIEGHLGYGGRLLKAHMTAGEFNVVPRDYPVDGKWSSISRALFLHFSRPLITNIAHAAVRGDPEHIELLPIFVFRDTLLRQLCFELYHELQNRGLFGTMFAESVANTITLHLLRNYSNASAVHQVRGGKLTPGQLRIVDEYIQAHLQQKISLADLAHSIYLSVPHFERLFRATCHCPPYHYVLERRIEKAKLLLSSTRLPLHDVAHECGFASQSHFTRHFTKIVGISPARFKRSVRK